MRFGTRRLLLLSLTYSALLTTEQQRLWNLIFHSYRWWPEGKSAYIALSEIFRRIDWSELQKQLERLMKIAGGGIPEPAVDEWAWRIPFLLGGVGVACWKSSARYL
jgi:hypothetical protein